MMRLAGICVAALMLVGCGADEVRDTVDPVAEAADKMEEAGGARVDGDMTIAIGGIEIPIRMDGIVSFEDEASRFELDFAEGGVPGATAEEMEAARREAEFPLVLITYAEDLYVSTPGIVRRGEEDGFRWLRVDHEEIDEEGGFDFSGINQMSEVNPQAMLRFLKTVADARETGKAAIDGAWTTRYTATVDIRDYPETVEPEKREAARRTVDALIKVWGSPTHRVHVWIDRHGLIRREEMTYSFTESGDRAEARVVLDFLDVGEPQEIAVPDDDEVKDISDEVADYFGEG